MIVSNASSQPVESDATVFPDAEQARHLADNSSRAEQVRPSTLRYIFFGAEGLRAGWGLLLFIAILAGSIAVVRYVKKTVRHHHSGAVTSKLAPNQQDNAGGSAKPKSDSNDLISPRAAILGEGSTFLIAMFATFILSRVERRRFGVYGLGGVRRLPQFLAGLFWGVACLSILVGVLRWRGFLHFDARLLSGGAAFRYGAVWAVGFLLVALLEESVLRGYAQYTLARGLTSVYGAIFKNTRHRRGYAQYTLARGLTSVYGAIFKNTRHRHALGFWTAAVVLSFIFGLGHSSNDGESPVGLLAAGLVGLVSCFALYRTGSLWWAIGMHAAWDWSQSFLYGVADSGNMSEGHLFATHPVGKPFLSGGFTGPEGSIFAILILGLIAGIILVTLRQSRRPGNDLPFPDAA